MRGAGTTAPQPATAREGARSRIPASPPADAPSLLQSFGGNTEGNAINSWGLDQSLVPPDPDVAVGPTAVVETTNSRLLIFNRDGSVFADADINVFVNVPSGYTVTDPRVIYDAQSGRFYFTVLEFQPSGCGSDVVLLVSPSGSLTNPWTGVVIPDSIASSIGDQPALGASNNLISVAMNTFQCSGGAIGAFLASELSMVQKSDLLTNHITANTIDVFTGGPFSVQPVQSIGSISTQYVVFNGSPYGASFIYTFAFTGTPEQRNMNNPVAQAQPMTQTSLPPAAQQIGSALTLQTDDDRFLNAVWQGDTIWAAGNTGCTPSGESTVRSCLGYISVTANASGTVTGVNQLPFVGVNGAYLFYPAVAVDSAGNLFTVFNESSVSTPIAVVAAGLDKAAGGTALTNFATLRTSSQFYSYNGASPQRWGDYLGAAQDPSHPTDVWVVGQDVEGDGPPCSNVNFCWDTYIGRYTFAAPTITSLTPAAGPTSGGQTVTVTGTDFLPGASATFAGSAITMGTLTSNSFQFTTPAHAAGLVYLQVTDALGSTPVPSIVGGYMYTALGNYAPVPPFRIYDSRPSTCVNCASQGPLAGGATRTITIAGGSGVGQNVVPTNATAVVINVTATNTTSNGFLTVFPNGTGRPTASNLNFAATQTVANLVTVALGQNTPADTSRELSVFNLAGTTHLVVDVAGYFTPTPSSPNAGTFHAIPPLRICDSRGVSASVGNNVCNHDSSTSHPLGTGQVSKVNVSGLPPGVPPGPPDVPPDGSAAAVTLNLTAVNGTGSTYLSVYPTNPDGTCSTQRPQFSNVNLLAGTVQPNRVMVPLGPDAALGPNTDICIYNFNGSINYLADLNGWYGTGSELPLGQQYQAIGPSRICDSRALSGTECSGLALNTGTVHTVQVAGVGGIPAFGSASSPTAVIMNVTAVTAASSTFLKVYPADVAAPNTSDVNPSAGATIPNLVVVELASTGTTGAVDIYNHVGTINFIFDVAGWFQ